MIFFSILKNARIWWEFSYYRWTSCGGNLSLFFLILPKIIRTKKYIIILTHISIGILYSYTTWSLTFGIRSLLDDITNFRIPKFSDIILGEKKFDFYWNKKWVKGLWNEFRPDGTKYKFDIFQSQLWHCVINL